jgi:hypothetical protein
MDTRLFGQAGLFFQGARYGAYGYVRCGCDIPNRWSHDLFLQAVACIVLGGRRGLRRRLLLPRIVLVEL